MNYPQRMYVQQDRAGSALFSRHNRRGNSARHIMVWIKRWEPLWNELQRLGYQEHSQYFSPRQVSTIFEYLGEPGA